MKDAFGSAYMFWMIIFFITLFIIFFASSLNYTKAFKAKNRIVEIIEKHDDVLNNDPSGCTGDGTCYLSTSVEQEINDDLSDMGYRVSSVASACEVSDRFENSYVVGKTLTNNYEYCIYGTNTDKGTYYGVRTYIYFEIPIFGIKMKFPVYGETKIKGILGYGG